MSLNDRMRWKRRRLDYLRTKATIAVLSDPSRRDLADLERELEPQHLPTNGEATQFKQPAEYQQEAAA